MRNSSWEYYSYLTHFGNILLLVPFHYFTYVSLSMEFFEQNFNGRLYHWEVEKIKIFEIIRNWCARTILLISISTPDYFYFLTRLYKQPYVCKKSRGPESTRSRRKLRWNRRWILKTYSKFLLILSYPIY